MKELTWSARYNFNNLQVRLSQRVFTEPSVTPSPTYHSLASQVWTGPIPPPEAGTYLSTLMKRVRISVDLSKCKWISCSSKFWIRSQLISSPTNVFDMATSPWYRGAYLATIHSPVPAPVRQLALMITTRWVELIYRRQLLRSHRHMSSICRSLECSRRISEHRR